MKTKAIWLILTALIVVALVVSSCQPPATETPQGGQTVTGKASPTAAPAPAATTAAAPATTTAAPAATKAGPEKVTDSLGRTVEKPQYGGKVSVAWTSAVPTQNWDIIISTTAATGGAYIYENLASLDWKRGPSGTGEYSSESSYVPDQYLAGDIAESWERIDTRTLIWHIRPGIRWQNKGGMNGREVTADDVVFSFQRGQSHPRSVYYVGPTVAEADRLKIEKLDKYTVKFTDPEPNTRGVHGQGQWLYIQPKEVIDKFGNLDDWRNAVGTGPWLLQDVVPDSSVLYKRNPTYWKTDPFHPDNQLPYLDFVEALVITDESTRIAALRTHKTDIYHYFPYDKVRSMQQTNPELKLRKMTPDYAYEIFQRVDKAPLNDKRVRQALQYAVDEPKIKDEYFGGDAVILGWPVHSYFTTHYTPVDKLPENLRQMFEYQPDIAKKLLAEAGYPNGFKTEIAVSATWAKGIEILSIVKENWKVIGVEMEIKPTESSSFVSLIYGKNYPSQVFLSWGNNGVDDAFGWAHDGWVGKGGAKSVYAFSPINDPIATETYRKLMDTPDFDERENIRREHTLREIDLAWEVSLPMPNAYTFWAPYLKGYSGESGIGPDPPQAGGIYQYVWIDKALRQQLTGVKAK